MPRRAEGNTPLAAARLQAQVRQGELAARVGIKRQVLSAYERGLREPRVSVAIRIARALGVSVESLWGALEDARDGDGACA